MNIGRPLICTILLVLLIIPRGGLFLFKKLKLLEHKRWAEFYRRKQVPTAQGVRLWLTLVILIALLGWNYLSNSYMIIYLSAMTLLATMATIDLFYPLSSWLRLSIQLLIFAGIVIYGGVHIDTFRMIGGDISLTSRIGVAVSIIRFVLCTNAINWFDGIEGQSSGVTAIGSFTLLAVVSLIVLPSYGYHLTTEIKDQLTITQIIALSLGLVSLIYTFIEYKPRGLLRDVGTAIYGFSLAYLALLGGAKVGTLVVVLSLVIFDSVRVAIHRIIVMKKSPLKGDYTHLHHRLLANSWSRSEIRRFVWLRSIFLAVLMLLQKTSSINKWIIFAMMAILFFGVNVYLFWIKKLPSSFKVDFKTHEVEELHN